tara:strand:- start:680 stop:1399 length:720 start_codon:yes stop_codon:yes gene_type:complete
MKNLLPTLALLLLVGCTSEPEVVVVVEEDTTYLMCKTQYEDTTERNKGYPDDLVYLVTVNKIKVFKDGIYIPHDPRWSFEGSRTDLIVEGYKTSNNRDTGFLEELDSALFLPFKKGEFQKFTGNSMSTGNDPDAFSYSVKNSDFYKFGTKDRMRTDEIVLNRETLELSFNLKDNDSRILPIYTPKTSVCEVTSKLINQEYRTDFLARENILEGKKKSELFKKEEEEKRREEKRRDKRKI